MISNLPNRNAHLCQITLNVSPFFQPQLSNNAGPCRSIIITVGAEKHGNKSHPVRSPDYLLNECALSSLLGLNGASLHTIFKWASRRGPAGKKGPGLSVPRNECEKLKGFGPSGERGATHLQMQVRLCCVNGLLEIYGWLILIKHSMCDSNMGLLSWERNGFEV